MCIQLLYFQECVFINKPQSSGLLMHDYIQLFKWTQEVIINIHLTIHLLPFLILPSFVLSCPPLFSSIFPSSPLPSSSAPLLSPGRAPDCSVGGRGFRSQTEPLLRVLKYLTRTCCLCYYICKRLNVQVSSYKDYKPLVPSPASSMLWFGWGRKRNHPLIAKSRA